MDNISLYKLWFANINLNERIKFLLLEQFKDECSIYENRGELIKTNLNLKHLMDLNVYDEELENQLKKIRNGEYNVVFYNDDIYPKNLKNIEDFPYVLYYRGDIERFNKTKAIAIVGARKCSNYGAEVTKYIVSNLEGYNVSVVSGGAYGIDTIAHRVSISKGIYNVAVFGCGIDICYPSNNKFLYEEIEKNGVLISEFAPKTPPFAYNFPRRNRIISGLSNSVIVVEASDKGGSLITAGYAANQGKEVFAVPGSIFSPLSNGVNKLIEDGANVFKSINDLKDIVCDDNKGKNGKNLDDGLKGKILKLLEDKPMHIDEIIRLIHIDTSLIYELLFEMQFNKEIISLTGNYYAKII